MAIQINGDGTITGISVGGLPDGIVDTDMLANNAVATGKIADNAVTTAKSSGLQRRVSTALTLPTNAGEITHNVTSGVKKIEILLSNVSGTGNNNLHIQLGDGGSYANSGYGHAMGYHRSSSPAVSNSSGAFATYGLDSSSYHIWGKWILYNSFANTWVSSFTLWGSIASNHEFWGIGNFTLSNAITNFKFYLGSGNFDQGYLTIIETMADD